MVDLFQSIPLTGNLNSSIDVTAGPVSYAFEQSDGAQIQNTGSMDNADSLGANNVVAGPSAMASGGGSTAIGQLAQVAGNNSIGVGQGTSVVGGSSVVVGSQSNTAGSNDVVLGTNASGGPGGNNVVIGRLASARPNGSYLSTTIGALSVSGNSLAAVVGSNSIALGPNDTIVGSNSSTGVSGNNTVVGEGSTTGNTAHTNNTVVGQGSTGNGGNCSVLGQGNNVTGGNCTAFGTGNTVSGAASIAIGTGNTVTHNNCAVVGLGNTGVSSIGNNQLLVSADGTQPPAVTGSGIIVHHASTNYTVLALSNSSGSSNGGVFNISIKDGVECAIGANHVGSGTFVPINFYTNGGQATFQIDTSQRARFLGCATGTGTVVLGSNSSSTVSAQPYTWADVSAQDGTLCVIPLWRK